MLFEQIKASPLQQQWKDEFDAQLWARPRHSWTVLFILTVLHTVVVISAFIQCQCLAIDIKFMHIQSMSVSKCHLPGATFKLKDVFFTTEFILNLLVVKCVRSAILLHSAIEMIIIFPVSAGHKMSLFYFSIVFHNCFHTITQDMQLSTFILYLFYYHLLLYHLYDGWIKLYCNKTNCHHKHLSVVGFFLLAIIILLLFLFPVNRIFSPVFKWWLGVLVLVP